MNFSWLILISRPLFAPRSPVGRIRKVSPGQRGPSALGKASHHDVKCSFCENGAWFEASSATLMSLLSQEPVFASVYSVSMPQYILCFNQVTVWASACWLQFAVETFSAPFLGDVFAADVWSFTIEEKEIGSVCRLWSWSLQFACLPICKQSKRKINV